MSENEAFFDTNVLLYLLSGDKAKADRAQEVISKGGIISVQVLNEFANVGIRKLVLSWAEIREILSQVRVVCSVTSITTEVHERGLTVAERYGFGIYDAMIVGAALSARCETLYSEDMQDGQVIDSSLTVRNPFTIK